MLRWRKSFNSNFNEKSKKIISSCTCECVLLKCSILQHDDCLVQALRSLCTRAYCSILNARYHIGIIKCHFTSVPTFLKRGFNFVRGCDMIFAPLTFFPFNFTISTISSQDYLYELLWKVGSTYYICLFPSTIGREKVLSGRKKVKSRRIRQDQTCRRKYLLRPKSNDSYFF